MNRLTISIGALLLFVFASCSQGRAVSVPANNGQTEVIVSADLLLPSIPITLTTPQDRADYLVRNFWENMDFADTLRSHDRTFMEQNFVNFIDLFRLVDRGAQMTAVENLLAKAEADRGAYTMLAEIAEHYLYDPNSPMLCEEHYILFLQGFIASAVLGDAERERWTAQLSDAMKNRPGIVAADFAFTDREGLRQTLHRAINGLTMLVFYDPDCEHCAEIMRRIEESEVICTLVDEKRLKVVAIYADGDTESWDRTKSRYPEQWTVGIDTDNIQERETYVLRAMPTIYLINADGTVWLKDPPVGAVIDTLASLQKDKI